MAEKRFLWPPKSLLSIKGRMDARKGPGAASAYVDKLRQRLAVLTAQETIATEKALQKIRQEASGRLAERNRTLDRLSALSQNQEEGAAADTRASRRDTEERDCLRASLAVCEEAILAANEKLINTQALLEKRVVRLRALTDERISLYIMGVRSGRGLKTFTCPQLEEPGAQDICFAGHHALDSELRRVAEELMVWKGAS